MKEDYQKNLDYQNNLIFSLAPSSFYEQDHEKQKGPGTRNQSLFGLKKMFKKTPSVVYYLGNFDDLIQSGFCVIYASQFMTS